MSDSIVVRVEILPTTPKELDEDVQWYFNAVAGNNEIVSTSETYTTKSDAERGAVDVFPGIPLIIPSENEEKEANDGTEGS